MGIDAWGRLYVLHVERMQETAGVWIESLIDLIDLWKPEAVLGETGHISKGIGPTLYRRMRERNVLCHVVETRPVGDKASRARSIQARWEHPEQLVWLPHDAPWIPVLTSEMLSFPNGAHDDQVDALSLVGLFMNGLIEGAEPPPSVEVVGPDAITLQDLYSKPQGDIHASYA